MAAGVLGLSGPRVALHAAMESPTECVHVQIHDRHILETTVLVIQLNMECVLLKGVRVCFLHHSSITVRLFFSQYVLFCNPVFCLELLVKIRREF